MVRKRLGDLLREEAQKTTEPETGEPALAAEIADAAAVAVSAEVVDAAAAATHGSESLDWETIAANLKLDLQLAQQREQALHQELTEVQAKEQQQSCQLVQRIEQLQADLEQSQATIAQLKTEVGQLEQLKADLETARREILRLTQVSSSQPAVAPPIPPMRAPVRSSVRSAPLPVAPKPALAQAPLMPRAYSRPGLKPISPHAVKPQTIAPRRPNLDIGWAD